MRGRNLLFLGIAVLAIGAYIVLFERHQMTTEQVLEKADRVFPTLEADDVTAIALTTAKGDFAFQRDGDQWQLTEPVAYPADQERVSSLLSAIVDLKSERVLKGTEIDPASYGLDDPDLSVLLTTNDGEHRLSVGDETPLGSNRAIGIGSRDVILVRSWFTSNLEHDLDEWRSHDLVDLAIDQVASIEIVTGDDRVQAVREGDGWRLLEPVADLADREHLRNLVSNLNALEVKEFLEPTPDLIELGLSPPHRRITVVRNDGAAPAVLEMGTTRERDGSTEIACRRDADGLFWITDRAQNSLDRAPVRWRSTVVYPFDNWDVRSITITDADGSSIGARRDEGLWSMTDGGEADTTEVLDRLGKLSRLEAVDYDLLAAGSSPRGSVVLELGDVDDDAAAELAFSFFSPLAPGGRALVEVTGRPGVMSVELEDVDPILGSPDGLRRAEPTPIAEPTADDAPHDS